MNDRDYYCSLKFRYLKIDLECQTTYNCHAAAPHPIDFDWLEKHPGQLFNTPINVNERRMMILNQRNQSCEQNCWPAEDRGAFSPRLSQQGQNRTHEEVFADPETIELTINSDCNLTCSYCCKEFSQSWRRDIHHNGEYTIPGNTDERFRMSEKDVRLMLQKQTDLKKDQRYQSLLDGIKALIPKTKRLIVTGGEPLLDNTLIEILTDIAKIESIKIVIYTGLGLSFGRFVSIFDQLKRFPNIEIRISAENTNKFAEFNRYGVVWSDFREKIKYLDEIDINYRFHMTMSNLTVHDFHNFFMIFGHKNNVLTFCYQPRFMAANVLDVDTKSRLVDLWHTLPVSISKSLIESITAEPTDLERRGIGEFLKQFTARRPNLSLGIFPQSFLKWAGI